MGHADYLHLSISIADGVCRATVSNPPVNLSEIGLLAELRDFIAEIATNDDVRVLVVDSADPDFFISHVDVRILQALPIKNTLLHDELSAFQSIVESIRTLPKATIAVVEGIARGAGNEIALAFDMCFAALGKARFAHPEVALGIIPGGGGTQRLPRLIGRARTLEMVLGGMDIDAATAEAWGFVNRALPPEQLRPFVDALAARIASFPLEAITRAKRAVDAAVYGQGDPTAGLNIENKLFRETMLGPAAAERMPVYLARGGQTREFELRDTPF